MLQPLTDKVVVQFDQVEQTTASGFVLPSSAKERQQVGQVLAIGPDVEESAGLKVNDKVVVRPHAGVLVDVNDQEYLVLEFKDILAVIA